MIRIISGKTNEEASLSAAKVIAEIVKAKPTDSISAR